MQQIFFPDMSVRLSAIKTSYPVVRQYYEVMQVLFITFP